MKTSPQKSGRLRAKQRRWLIAGLVLLVLGAGAVVFGYLYFPKYNEQRLVRKAEAFRAAKDFQSAAITAQRALQINERNLAAVRILASMTDEAGSPAALIWKQRLVELEPGVPENRLSLAESALELDQPALASETLEAAREASEAHARYHELVGRTARATGDLPKAEMAFAEAARREPTSVVYQLEWQAARLESKDETTRAAARGALEDLLVQRTVFVRASRWLIGEALQRRDATRALKLAADLEKHDLAGFPDRLIYLDLLHRLKRPNYATYLTTLQEEAAGTPEHLYRLIGWLNERHSALLVVDWSRRLPAEMLTTMPVPVALAQSYVRLRDWAGLKPIIAESAPRDSPPAATGIDPPVGPWGNYEFLRLAYLAAMHRAEGDLQQSKLRWNAAVKSAGSRAAAVSALARYAVEWGWDSDATEVLWKVARASPDQKWALRFLYRTYQELQATSNLQQVAAKVLEAEPENRDMVNNHAMLSLLLGTKVAETVERMRELHRLEPTNPNYVSTYALGLFLQGFTAEAVALMKSLTPEQLREPGIAVYYGIVLSATEAKEEARTFLEAAKEARLLPEEQRLLDQAWERVERSAAAPAAAPVE